MRTTLPVPFFIFERPVWPKGTSTRRKQLRHVQHRNDRTRFTADLVDITLIGK